MGTRIYVIVVDGVESSLVEATNASQAIKHATKDKFVAIPATTKDVVRLMNDGLTVDNAARVDEPTTGDILP